VPFPAYNSVVHTTLLLYSCVPGQLSSAVPRLIFICESIMPILTRFSWPLQAFRVSSVYCTNTPIQVTTDQFQILSYYSRRVALVDSYFLPLTLLNVKMEGKGQTGFAWLRLETSRELLWTRYWTSWFH